VQLQPGGYGVAWDTNMTISDSELYRTGQDVPLSAGDFKNFVVQRIVTAAEAAEILDCSRQNVDDLTKRGKLHPIKTGAKTTLFLKSEILKRNWQ
jgi:predicted DNA-binding transcriptional regulator AlpA